MKNNFLISMSLKHKESINFAKYPFSIPVVKNLTQIDFHPQITYIVGENGSGKSTLLEALAISQGFNAEGGTKNFNFYTKNTHSNLYQYLKVVRSTKKIENGFFLRAESFYNLANNIDDLEDIRPGLLKYYGSISLHRQSHGESFISLIKNRFTANGLYILDEPEAALSPNRQMALLALIHDLIYKGSQFIVSTHSPILLSYPNSTIYEIDSYGKTNKVLYEDTDIYTEFSYFLNNYKKFFKNLGI